MRDDDDDVNDCKCTLLDANYNCLKNRKCKKNLQILKIK